MKIDKIYVYPVKALRAVEVEECVVTKHGFPHDRRFMLVQVEKDKEGQTIYTNIHIASHPESVLFHPSLDTSAGIIRIDFKPPNDKNHKTLEFPLVPDTQNLEIFPIDMHLSPIQAYKMPQNYSNWFSQCYGYEVSLIYLGPENYRPIRMSSSPKNTSSSSSSSWLSSITSTAASYLPFGGSSQQQNPNNLLTFNDCAPYLITSTKSLEDVQSRLTCPISDIDDMMIKFRPNITISSSSPSENLKPWDEDFWSQITITSSSSTSSKPTRIECIHNCGRCKSINIDYTTGKPGGTNGGEDTGNVLKKMQRDRRVDIGIKYSPVFGRYSFLNDEDSEGNVIKKGDEVVVSRRNEEHTAFDWEGLHTLPKTTTKTAIAT